MRILTAVLAVSAIAMAGDIKYPFTTTWEGTRGLSQTRSAEPLGQGMLVFSLRGGLNPTNYEYKGFTPSNGASVFTALGSVGYGLNNYFDLSAWASANNVYNSVVGSDLTIRGLADTGTANGGGLGSSGVTMQWSFPIPKEVPLRLAVQAFAVAGTSKREIYKTVDPVRGWVRPDGYTYFETRTGYDFGGRFVQTLLLGNEFFPVRIHFNEGLVNTVNDDKLHPILVLGDGGIDMTPVPWFTLSGEAHMRTVFKRPAPFSDPFWGTVSGTVHMGYGSHLTLGTDFNAATAGGNNRPIGTHALEKWRAFGQLYFGLDLFAERRAALAAKLKADSLERVRLANLADENQRLLAELAAKKAQDSIENERQRKLLAQKMYDDSVAAARKRYDDSVMAVKRAYDDSVNAARMRDSMALMAAKARQDSIDAARRLEDERNRKGDAETEFLRTGVLNLESVYFVKGSSKLEASSRPYLKLVGAMLAKFPTLKLEVSGHTDNVGKAKANQLLSLKRAQSVRVYLVGLYPTMNRSLTAKGYGSTQPVADNTTADGREQNRRVEIIVLNPEELKRIAASKNITK